MSLRSLQPRCTEARLPAGRGLYRCVAKRTKELATQAGFSRSREVSGKPPWRSSTAHAASLAFLPVRGHVCSERPTSRAVSPSPGTCLDGWHRYCVSPHASLTGGDCRSQHEGLVARFLRKVAGGHGVDVGPSGFSGTPASMRDVSDVQGAPGQAPRRKDVEQGTWSRRSAPPCPDGTRVDG